MKTLCLLFVASLACANAASAQSETSGSTGQNLAQQAPQAAAVSKSCLAVRDVGSHAFRNIMLAGVAGALISKKQYAVVDSVDYPATPGQKFHGNDLQMLQTGGVRVVILSKKYSSDDLHRACR
jgi:hypothetical protein